jgi:hypothetical protein
MQPILRVFCKSILLFFVTFFLGGTPQYVAAQACTNTYLVWDDCDADGQKGVFENGLSGVNVTLFNANCAQLQQVMTNGSGNYSFGNLSPSTMYYVVFGNGQCANGVLNLANKSRNLSPPNMGAEATDSDAQMAGSGAPACANGKPYIRITTNASGCVDGLLDAGFVRLDFQVNSISMTAETCNGSRNGSISINLSNITGGFSTLITGGTPMANQTTFNNLAPGNYDIEIRSFSPICNTFYKRTVTISAGPTITPPTVTDDATCRYDVNPQNGGLKATTPPCPTGGTPTVTWWTAQTGGVKVYTGPTFNPIAQNVVNAATAGTTTFWAQCECGVCSSVRVRGNFVVKERPEPRITGEQFICTGNSQTYTTPSVAGNTYVWSLPNGGGTISAVNNNSVTILWSGAQNTSYKLRLVETNAVGCNQPIDYQVSMIQTNLACIGSINATIDAQCRFTLDGNTLLGGAHLGSSKYKYQLQSQDGRVLEEGVGQAVIDGIDNNGNPYFYVGKQLIYAIYEPCGDSNCWGYINFEDKTAPTITPPSDFTLFCSQIAEGQIPLPTMTGKPTIVEECSKTDTYYTEIVREAACTQPFLALPTDLAALKPTAFPNTGDIIKIIFRAFTVKDANNNSSICSHYIFIRKNHIENIICPTAYSLDCRNYSDESSIAPSVTGVPIMDTDGDLNTTYDRYVAGTGSCRMNVSYTDQRVNLCANGFRVIRTWRISDPCAVDNPQTSVDERLRECSQTITVTDKTAPSVSATFTQYYVENNNISTRDTITTFDGYYDVVNSSGNAGTIQSIWALGNNNVCGGKTSILFRMKDEGCVRNQVNIISSDSRMRMATGYPQYDATTGEYVALYEVTYTEMGDYDVLFTAADECGLMLTKKTFRIKIRDNVKPNVVCKSFTQAALTNLGSVRAYAESFNNGSTDNCGVEKIEIRRMANCQSPADTTFRQYVDFSCCDANMSIPVILRVWDAHGNYNECMVITQVVDKIAPTCTAPSNRIITCQDYIATALQSLGKPTFWDNCRVVDTVYTEIESLDNCKVGTISRKWVISDATGLKDSCQQQIIVRGKSDFTVDFPDDILVNCFASVPSREQARLDMLNNGRDKDGHIENNGCGVLVVEVTDDTLTATPDACYKILRKFSVVDWCKFNPNNYDRNSSCYGLPVCGDVHSNTSWASQNLPSWQFLNRPACTNPSERRFRDADDLGGITQPYSPYAYSDGMICFTQIIKVVDNIAPEFTSCPKDTVIKSYANLGCIDDIKLSVTASDLCAAGRTTNAEYLLFKWAIVDSTTGQVLKAGYGNTLFEPFDYNRNYRVVWSVEDRCGNRTYCTQKVKVMDAKKPGIICQNVNAELIRMSAAGGNGMIQVWASDILASPLTDNCTPSSYLQQRIALEKDNLSTGSYPSVQNTSLFFSCSEAGQIIPVRLWTKDAAGNADYCLARVTVQDNMNICNTANMANISGETRTESGESIASVTMTASMNSTVISNATTTTSGNYSFNSLLRGNNYSIRALRDDAPLNGVTTFDLALMSKHILGIAPLSTPYKIIAADINRDGDVTAVDILQTRRMILRLQTLFPNNTTSWRFIDRRYTFNDPTDPLAEDFPEVVNVANAPLATQADFVGLKVGDVSGNASTGSSATTTVRGAGKSLIINTDDMDMKAGEDYKVTFKSDDFNAQGYQFTLNVIARNEATGGVEIVSVEKGQLPNLAESNFGRFKNALTTSWNGQFEGKTDDMFSIVLRAKQNTKLSEVLTIGSNLTVAEAYDKAGEAMNVKLVFKGNHTEGGNFALYQNEPNPFDNQTKISFNLPTEGETKLTVYDVAGRILKTINQKFAKGYNEIQLTKEDIKATGILYYRLDTPTHSATKKMIIIP